MKLIEYLYTLNNTWNDPRLNVIIFIEELLDWQECSDKDFIGTLENIPSNVLNEYMVEGKMYRGMKVLPQQIWNSDFASWTSRRDQAMFIAVHYCHSSELYGNTQELKIQIYEKYGKGICLNKIMKECGDWMTTNEEYVLSKIDVESLDDIFEYFRVEECEILSDFNLETCNLNYCEDVEKVHNNIISGEFPI